MHFYLQMSGSYTRGVCLPQELTTKLSPLIGKFIKLKLSNGATWRVNLISSGTKLALKDGWHDFVHNNSIKENDHLFFKFKGNSEFKVLILSSIGVEKSLEREAIGINLEESNDDYNDDNNNNNMINLNNFDCNEDKEGKRKREIKANTCKKIVRKKPRINTEDVVVPIEEIFYLPQGLIITNEQKIKALELLTNIKKENPIFLQILKPAHISTRFSLAVPRNFCREYLRNETMNFILRRPNKKKNWTVICNYNKKHHEIRWVEFVRENKLEENDICLFELDKGEKEFTFIVHVTRI